MIPELVHPEKKKVHPLITGPAAVPAYGQWLSSGAAHRKFAPEIYPPVLSIPGAAAREAHLHPFFFEQPERVFHQGHKSDGYPNPMLHFVSLLPRVIIHNPG